MVEIPQTQSGDFLKITRYGAALFEKPFARVSGLERMEFQGCMLKRRVVRWQFYENFGERALLLLRGFI